uniref:F-box domain-containing protein n=1 Tax=Globodera rostochiensis TaxID=31243 RepID=A0A914HNT5_GLORO
MIDDNNKNKRPRYLPSEVWADVFSLIRRDEWACPDRRGPNLVNRRFSALAHARLHERGALLLRLGSKFRITFSEAFPKAIRDYKEMPLPYAPLPKNIVGLEQPTEILLSI